MWLWTKILKDAYYSYIDYEMHSHILHLFPTFINGRGLNTWLLAVNTTDVFIAVNKKSCRYTLGSYMLTDNYTLLPSVELHLVHKNVHTLCLKISNDFGIDWLF